MKNVCRLQKKKSRPFFIHQAINQKSDKRDTAKIHKIWTYDGEVHDLEDPNS